MYNIFHEVRTVLGKGPEQCCHGCQINSTRCLSGPRGCLLGQVHRSPCKYIIFSRDVTPVAAGKKMPMNTQGVGPRCTSSRSFCRARCPDSWEQQRKCGQLHTVFRWWDALHLTSQRWFSRSPRAAGLVFALEVTAAFQVDGRALGSGNETTVPQRTFAVLASPPQCAEAGKEAHSWSCRAGQGVPVAPAFRGLLREGSSLPDTSYDKVALVHTWRMLQDLTFLSWPRHHCSESRKNLNEIYWCLQNGTHIICTQPTFSSPRGSQVACLQEVDNILLWFSYWDHCTPASQQVPLYPSRRFCVFST